MNEINGRADKIMQNALWGFFAFGLFLAPFYGTWSIALGVGTLCLLAYWVTRFLLPRYGLHRYVSSAVIALYTAQYIYQMHGMFEMHFVVFVGCTLLIVYQNWKLQLPLITLVVIHHGTLAYLQNTGVKDVFFTQMDGMDLQTFLFHGGLAALVVLICAVWAYQLRRNTLKSAEQIYLYGQQRANINSNIHFAEEISRGNLDVHFEADENDALSKALLNMRQSLLVANEREQQEKFKTLGLAEVSEILRATHDLHELAEKVIVKLVKYMKANQGGLFILHEESNGEGHLELAACYAYDRKKYLQKSVQVGEGLVGQAVLERDVIYLTEVPANYISIKSGLGGANPRSILIVPLVVNDKIEGVIELASFNLFQPFEIEFMQKLGESIASTIASVKINERTKHLLEESQMQSEQMRAQEEEMRQNMEEIAATQEEMQRKNSEMERLVSETQEQSRQLSINEKRVTAVLNSVSAAIIQTDAEGNIQSVNEVGESMFGYGKGALSGTSLDAMLPGVRAAGRKEGERNNETAHRQNGTTFISSVSFKKLVTEEGTLFLYFVSDIDEDVKREREMQRKQEEIATLLEQARDNEEMMRAQEEIMKQNLEEVNAIQESLKEKADETERARQEEKTRAEALIESQKKVMEKVIQKHREKEEQMNVQLAALQAELDKRKR
ncbi:MAG: hypothetical protein AVDCRST_MAG56-5667 [uncultured Cytophagales bacterium]|uniref:PAS domain-containing protein n=1 Tax=uncultured Cytophagales bacterium TaxID=158755 RepID=A0A6J4KG54_9SPHI|nr:MAG: hypothetical protein AVDCRST_MAG56-5667 [uncultured Cytophagales bacterium]